MQSTRTNRKATPATHGRRVSLTKVEREVLDLDRMMLEAIERIERVHSKAVLAVGTILSSR